MLIFSILTISPFSSATKATLQDKYKQICGVLSLRENMILRDREIVCKKAPCPRNDRGEKDQYIEFALSDKGSVTTFEILGNGSNGLSAELKERANSVLCVKFESDKSGNWNQFRRIVNQVTQVRGASVR